MIALHTLHVHARPPPKGDAATEGLRLRDRQELYRPRGTHFSVCKRERLMQTAAFNNRIRTQRNLAGPSGSRWPHKVQNHEHRTQSKQ